MLLTFLDSLKGEVAVLSKRHRKSSKKVVVQRTVTAAGAVAATASLAFVGPTAQAAAAAPDYKGAVTDYKNALNNYLSGTNAIGTAAGGVWNPLAQGSGGLLPTFGTSLTHSNLTKIGDLPDVLRNLASTPLPTAVPGVIPAIKIPGQGFVDLPLPTTIPGASVLNGLANALDGVFNNPVIGPIVNQLPPLSDIVDGLIAEQDTFTAGYNWPLLQASGLTTIMNTFVQTPSGLNIKIPAALDPLGILPDSVRILPDGTLPNVTAWVPMGAGNYTFPLGMETGWWATAPTLIVDGGAVNVPQTVLSIPMWANGITAPLGLGQAGQFNAHVLIPTQNGIYSPIGTTLSNFSIPVLGLGMTNLNVTTGNYLGTNGFNVNNGQNVMVLQTPFSGALPVPLVYSLGGFNFGTEGAGFTLPSLFGVGLMPSFQLGTAPGANTPLGVIPPNLIPTGAVVPTQLITVSGLISTALGIPDPTVELAKALTPLYKGLVTPALTPISDLLTQQYGNLFNGAASNTLQASKFYKDVMTQLGGLIGAAPLSSPVPKALAAADIQAGSRARCGSRTGGEGADRPGRARGQAARSSEAGHHLESCRHQGEDRREGHVHNTFRIGTYRAGTERGVGRRDRDFARCGTRQECRQGSAQGRGERREGGRQTRQAGGQGETAGQGRQGHPGAQGFGDGLHQTDQGRDHLDHHQHR